MTALHQRTTHHKKLSSASVLKSITIRVGHQQQSHRYYNNNIIIIILLHVALIPLWLTLECPTLNCLNKWLHLHLQPSKSPSADCYNVFIALSSLNCHFTGLPRAITIILVITVPVRNFMRVPIPCHSASAHNVQYAPPPPPEDVPLVSFANTN